jgi:hypothetical protein
VREEDWLPPPSDEHFEPASDAIKASLPLAAAPQSKPVAASLSPSAAPVPTAGAAPGASSNALPPIGALPIAEPTARRDGAPLHITIRLSETGNMEKDKRRLRILHQLFLSYSGKDRFCFHVYEEEKTFLADFPSHLTDWCVELERRVRELVGPGCIEVKPWRVL